MHVCGVHGMCGVYSSDVWECIYSVILFMHTGIKMQSKTISPHLSLALVPTHHTGRQHRSHDYLDQFLWQVSSSQD